MSLETNEIDNVDKEIIFRMKFGLSEDDIATLKLLTDGKTYQEIADHLGVITLEGVKKRMNKILNNLGVENKVQAVVKATKEGII